MWQIWIILAGIFIICEMIIPTDFIIFWVGIGASIAALCSIFTDNLTIQIGVFCISSILLIFCTKPFIRKFTKNSETLNTNIYSLIGKEGIVTTEIDPISGIGQVKVGGEVWSAKTIDNTKIPKDTLITVTALEGVKAVVAVKEKVELQK